jgi:hypothetical protein
MADINTSNPQNLFLGINQDNYISKTPNFVLNGMLESGEQSEQGIITSEESNKLCYSLPNGYRQIGSITMSNNEIALFATNNVVSKIFILKDCLLTEQVSGSLNFKDTNLIQGTFKIHKGCERVAYWNDNHLNPDRYFNFDDVNNFKTGGVFDSKKFNLIPDKKFISVKAESVNSTGGSLELGQYFFQVDVLDSNQKSVYSSLLSNSIVIYDDAQNLAYNQIDGGLNYPQFTAEVGGVPKTNKSINLKISNLDTSYSYVRLKVLKFTSADKTTFLSHLVGSLVPITSTSIDFLYTGFNVTNGDTSVDNSELTIITNPSTSSSYMEQVQSRMIRGNIKEETVDYSTFQSFANNINSGWIVKEHDYNDSLGEGNNKNPLTYQDFTGYMSDEVYAFGVVYVLENGTISPVFHIPGRASNSNDLLPIAVGTDVSVDFVKHVKSNAVNGDVIPKWKLVNTAGVGIISNIMSYYEDEQAVYPATQNCNGDNIFGTLVGQKIRHHKFPDRTLVPLINANKKSQTLGIQFDNITYPTGVVGHFFVRGERNELNKTVLDGGYLSTHFASNSLSSTVVSVDRNLNTINAVQYTVNNINCFISPKTYLTKEYLNGNYFKSIYKLEKPLSPKGYVASEAMTPTDVTNGFYGYYNTARYFYGKNYLADGSGRYNVLSGLSNNHLINTGGYIKENSTTNQFGFGVKSTNFLDSIFCLKTNTIPQPTPFTDNLTRVYGYIKVYKSVYSNLSTIMYERVGEKNQNICFNGDVFLSTSSVLFGHYEKVQIPNFTSTLTNIDANFDIDLLFESEINFGIRHQGTDTCNTYYKNTLYSDYGLELIAGSGISGSPTTGDMSAHIRTKLYTTATPKDLIKTTFCKEFTSYNLDYNKISNPQKLFPLASSYDYCSKCRNDFKNRIVYSEKSFAEESNDSYLIYKANNYVDVPANRGEITGLKYKENNLLVHTTDTTFIIKPNPQILTTNQTDVVLGTGDFLSFPAQELITTDTGHGGCQHRFGKCNTPFGYFWVDQKNGAIYKFDNQFETISRLGLYNYFKENLKDFMYAENVSIKDNPYYSDFIHLYYDERYKRLLLTKIDYKVNIHPQGSVTSVTWSDIAMGFVDPQGYKVSYFAELVFENKSFTLSFYPETKSWVSWHSYLPQVSLFDYNSFITSKNGRNFYRHDDEKSFRSFYGEIKPFIIEYPEQSYETKDVIDFSFISRCKIFDSVFNTWKEIKNITFDKLWIHSINQSTGKLNLVYLDQVANPFGNLPFSYVNKNIINTDKNYKVSNIYKNVNTSPVYSNAWYDINSNYFIDKVPVLNETFEQIRLSRIKDKQIFCRLEFTNPSSVYKLSLFLSNLNQQISIR